MNTQVNSGFSTTENTAGQIDTAAAPAKGAVQRQYAALDGFRIFAIAAIVLYHFRSVLGFEPPVVLNLAGSLVGYFFVLSGFILAHQYPDIANAPQYFRYLGARVARIWPTAVACLLLTCALNPLPLYDHSKFWPAFIANLFLVQSWVADRNYYLCFNAPAWTLSVDMFLYLLLPVAIGLATKSTRLLMGSFILSFAASVAAFFAFPREVDWAWAVCPLVRVFEFSLGVVAYRLHKEAGKYSAKKSLALEAVLISFWLLLASGFAYSQQLNGAKTPTLDGIDFTTFCITKIGGHFLPAISYALIVVLLAYGQGILARIFGSPILVTISKVSCSLYLIHFSLIIYFRSLSQNFAYKFDGLIFAGALLAVFAASVVMYLAVEKPFRNFINTQLENYFATNFANQTVRRWPAYSKSKTAKPFYTSTIALFVVAVMLTIALFTTITIRLATLKTEAMLPTPLSATLMNSAILRSRPTPRQVVFANNITLEVLEISREKTLALKTYWHAKTTSNPLRLAIHLLDESGHIVAQKDHALLAVKNWNELRWCDVTTMQTSELKNCKRIGLALIENGAVIPFIRPSQGALAPDTSGVSDWGDKRLLIEI